MEDHFVIFDNIVRELESTGTKLDEDDKVCHLLITIPEKYETVITAMETIADKLTLEFVKSRLLDAELKLKNDDEIDNNLDTSFSCFSCGKRGHKQFQCPERYQKTDKRGKLRNYCQKGRSYNYRRGNYSNPGGAHQTNDYCLYYKNSTIMLLYVDDIILTGEQIEETVRILKERFNAKDLGELKEFIGIQIHKEKDRIKLSQQKMIEKTLKTFKMEECKGSKTPMEVNFKVDDEAIINVPYRQIIGCIMYISLGTRPDITYAITYLSQFLDRPTQKAWIAAKRVLRYLKATKELSLTFIKNKEEKLIVYSDSDWAGNPLNRKSIAGGIILYHWNPVNWFSRKQNCVALSSTEAEYISAALACAEILNIRGIDKDLHDKESNIKLFIDNQSTIHLIKNNDNGRRSKHIEVKYHFVKDLFLRNIVNIDYIPTQDNLADILTKSLGSFIF